MLGGLLSGCAGAVGGVAFAVFVGGRTAVAPMDGEMLTFTLAGAVMGSVLGWQLFQRWLRMRRRRPGTWMVTGFHD